MTHSDYVELVNVIRTGIIFMAIYFSGVLVVVSVFALKIIDAIEREGKH
jgi:hypothetical protein